MFAKATDVGLELAVLDKSGFDAVADLSENISTLDITHVFRMLMKGEVLADEESILRIIKKYTSDAVSYIELDASKLMIPVFLSVIVKILLDKGAAHSGIQFICRLCASIIMAESFTGVKAVGENLIGNILRISETISPVLISAVGLTGAVTVASLLSPMASLNILAITWGIKNICMRLLEALVLVAVSGNLSENFRLKRLFKLIKNVILWLTGLMIAGFTALLSVQGLMGGSLDSIKLRSMQYTAESIIPVIGGEVSDSMDSLIAGTVAIKNAMGISGIVLLGSVCVGPVLRLAVFGVFLKAIAAIIEPAADACISETAVQFGEIAQILTVMCIGCMLLVILLIGAGITAAGSLAR